MDANQRSFTALYYLLPLDDLALKNTQFKDDYRQPCDGDVGVFYRFVGMVKTDCPR